MVIYANFMEYLDAKVIGESFASALTFWDYHDLDSSSALISRLGNDRYYITKLPVEGWVVWSSYGVFTERRTLLRFFGSRSEGVSYINHKIERLARQREKKKLAEKWKRW